VANNFYINNLPDVDFYFEPLSDDTGIAIGAAMIFLIAAKIKALMLSKQQAAATQKEAMVEGQKAGFSIWGSLAKIPFGVGLALAAATVGLMFAGISSLFSKGDDVFSPGGGSGGYGSRTLMGPEGAIQLNNKDSVIAGTDLFSKSTQSQSTQTVSPMAASNNSMINTLISEFRGVRADMASGKIGVYMDNDKVTANITRTTDNSTRNNFALT
jgi:hypothetical protein